jgi:hypothetical protein
MINNANLPIQYSAGLKPTISRGVEKSPDSYRVSQAQPIVSPPYFQTHLSENIIDVYERSLDNITVPDERRGVDRRQSANRNQTSPESAPLQSDKNVTYTQIYSSDHKINQIHTRIENTPLAIFSPSPQKGKLIDIWV